MSEYFHPRIARTLILVSIAFGVVNSWLGGTAIAWVMFAMNVYVWLTLRTLLVHHYRYKRSDAMIWGLLFVWLLKEIISFQGFLPNSVKHIQWVEAFVLFMLGLSFWLWNGELYGLKVYFSLSLMLLGAVTFFQSLVLLQPSPFILGGFTLAMSLVSIASTVVLYLIFMRAEYWMQENEERNEDLINEIGKK